VEGREIVKREQLHEDAFDDTRDSVLPAPGLGGQRSGIEASRYSFHQAPLTISTAKGLKGGRVVPEPKLAFQLQRRVGAL